MKTANVGEIQRNFAKVLQRIKAGEEVLVMKHGKVVGKFTSVGPQTRINWPDFMADAITVNGKPVSEMILEDREERF